MAQSSLNLAACLHSVGFDMMLVPYRMSCPLLDVVQALTACLQGTDSGSLYCPRAGPIQGVVSCTYKQLQRSEPYSLHRRYCQLPVSRNMQHLLHFRLGRHGLPIAVGRLTGAGHVDRANRACSCDAIGNEYYY